MCMNADCGLTMANLLADPLIAMVMHSDGVSHDTHAALWQRIEDASAARFLAADDGAAGRSGGVKAVFPWIGRTQRILSGGFPGERM